MGYDLYGFSYVDSICLYFHAIYFALKVYSFWLYVHISLLPLIPVSRSFNVKYTLVSWANCHLCILFNSVQGSVSPFL